MIVGDRLRQIRELKNFSQGDVEKRTGLLRCYVSRVENGHTIPSIETLEKMAKAFEVPLYQLFYEGEGKPPNLIPPNGKTKLTKKQNNVLHQIALAIPQIPDRDIQLLLVTAKQLSKR